MLSWPRAACSYRMLERRVRGLTPREWRRRGRQSGPPGWCCSGSSAGSGRRRFGRPRLIMSADRDFYQLLADDVQVLNTAMHPGKRHIGPAQVVARYGAPPPSGRASGHCAETRRTTSPASGESDRPPPHGYSPMASLEDLHVAAGARVSVVVPTHDPLRDAEATVGAWWAASSRPAMCRRCVKPGSPPSSARYRRRRRRP